MRPRRSDRLVRDCCEGRVCDRVHFGLGSLIVASEASGTRKQDRDTASALIRHQESELPAADAGHPISPADQSPPDLLRTQQSTAPPVAIGTHTVPRLSSAAASSHTFSASSPYSFLIVSCSHSVALFSSPVCLTMTVTPASPGRCSNPLSPRALQPPRAETRGDSPRNEGTVYQTICLCEQILRFNTKLKLMMNKRSKCSHPALKYCTFTLIVIQQYDSTLQRVEFLCSKYNSSKRVLRKMYFKHQ